MGVGQDPPYCIAKMLLIPNATNEWTKSELFLPTLHPGNQQSCLQEISVMQYARACCNLVLSACACHKCARRVSYSIRLTEFSCKQFC